MTPRERYTELVHLFDFLCSKYKIDPNLKLVFKDSQRGYHMESNYFGEKEKRIYLPLWLLGYARPWRIQYLCHEIAHELAPSKDPLSPHDEKFKNMEYALCKEQGIIIPGWSRDNKIYNRGKLVRIEHNAYAQTILHFGKSYEWGAKE